MKSDLARYQRIAAKVDSFEGEMRARSDDELRGLRAVLRDRGGDLDALLPMAFAAAREAARRTLGERMYQEQILGAVALHEGAVVQMNTGEGKTLTAVAPAYLHALSGHGVHVLTGDDYLAKRDFEWMSPVYQALGLTCGLLADGSAKARRAAYAADVTYGNHHEFAYDFLRDGLASKPSELRQRERRFAIVDEADLVMIDEALNTAMISEKADAESYDLAKLAAVARELRSGTDYVIKKSPDDVELINAGTAHAERLLGISSLDRELRGALRMSLLAREFWRRDRDYFVEGDRVRMVDWHTGRVTDAVSWEVAAALSAKEGLPIPPRKKTLARISVRGYLLGYQRLTAMTGFAVMDAEAYQSIYELPVVTIPPYRPVVRVDNQTKLYGSEQWRAAAVVREVVARHATGQPVLVGTSSIEYSEQISALLAEAGVPNRVLNAKQHADEARIIAKAAELGAVTVITKMAGRGVDIQLGGASGEQRAEVVAAGGLYVLGTNVFVTWRLEQHLRGRAGRQGDPGESDMFYCMDDPAIRALMGRHLNMIDKMMRLDEKAMTGRYLEYFYRRALRKHAERMSAKIIGQVAYSVVFDEHRAAVFRLRQAAIQTENIQPEIMAMIDRLTDAQLTQFVPLETDPDESVRDAVRRAYQRREAEIDAIAGAGEMRYLERRVVCVVIDREWPKHIEAMDALAEARRPTSKDKEDEQLARYRRDAAKLFSDTLTKIDEDIVGFLFNLVIEKDE